MSDSLRVPLSALPEGQEFTVNATVAEEDVRPAGAETIALLGATLTGVLSTAGGEFFFQGAVSGEFRRACDRCLEVADRRFTQDAAWAFAPGAPVSVAEGLDGLEDCQLSDEDAGEEPARHVEGDEINLAPPLWEELVLLAPAKFLCDDECKGLCPQCGANRNSGDCGCVSQSEEMPGRRGLAALKDLFPGLRGGSSEE